MKPSILKIATVLGLLSWSSLSFALNANSGQNISLGGNDSPNFNIGIQTGLLNGETKEQVFWAGRKLSELTWDFQDVVYVGGVVSAELWERVYLNAGYWTDASSGGGGMSDRDYLAADPIERSHLSTHDAELNKWESTDLNLGVAFLRFGGETVSSASPFGIDSGLNFQAILGYRTDEASWDANGGFAFYPEGIYVLDGTVIEYARDISMPYIGLQADLTISKKLAVNFYYLKSKWVDVDDEDTHVLRDLHFSGSMSDGRFRAYGANLRWEIWNNVSLNASVSIEDIDNTEGSSVARDIPSNDIVDVGAGGSAAVENSVSHVSGGISYQFG